MRQPEAPQKEFQAQSKTNGRKIDAPHWARDINNEMSHGLIELAAQSHAAQDDYLSSILGKGIPISYRNNHGELVRELPDGKIDPIMEAL
jgi:hypothetical protein